MNQDTDKEILLAIMRSESVERVTPENWQAVAHRAHNHRLVPLLFWRLQTLGLTCQVPSDLLQELRSEYLCTGHRNLRIYRQLTSLFDIYHRENVLCIPLKGAYLAEHIYCNIAVRPMSDVDILVKETDLARADALMVEMDFARTAQVDEVTHDWEHFRYTHRETGLVVEVHWNLMIASIFGVNVDIGSLWERSRTTLVAGIPVYEMSPEDLVLHLCLHTAKHISNGFQLSAICDLAETLRWSRESLDWERLILRGRQWGAERCVYLSLQLAKNLLNAPVPDDLFVGCAAENRDSFFLSMAEQMLFQPEEENGRGALPSTDFARFWAAKDLRSRLGMLWRSFFPSRQVLAAMYHVMPNSPRIFLYYPVRMWDLVKHYTRVVLRLFRAYEQMRIQVESSIQSEALRTWLLPAWSSDPSRADVQASFGR